MPTIRLTNTRTRRKEELRPLDPRNVRMYVCGPTVYDRAHLGNARPVVVFDVLFRLLRHTCGADHVTYVRNFTDVDDKINDTAAARKAAGDPRPLEELIRERTEETVAWYHADMDALGALRPTHEPRATEWIGAMIAMIQDLIARGHAYEAQGHVLFRVRSYKAYGQLSGRSLDDMIAGARVEVAPFKEDPLDFVLWKPSDEATPGWDSPWGRGRPGWHIECSAMAASSWAPASTSTAEASTSSSPITRTRSPNPAAPIPRASSPASGCTMRCSRWRGRRCRSPSATSSPCGIC
jgi:cysteinyl-tRNA synthetase